MELHEAVAKAAAGADERTMADLRRAAADEVEGLARSADFRERAAAFRAISQLHYRDKNELLRRGLDDESPACRGSALLSLEQLSRDHPGDVNAVRPRLHTMATTDPNQAVRRLAVLSLKNGSPQPDTLTLLAHLAEEAEEKDLRAAAQSVHRALKQKQSARR
jgi:HEAT repeat protein